MSNTEIISAFPGTGKTHFYNETLRYSNRIVLDSDSSRFDKLYFPENYIEHIIDNLGKADIIFVSSHKEVRDAMVSAGLEFVLVYPKESLKLEYLERYRSRGSSKEFIDLIDKHWLDWVYDLESQGGCYHTVLDSGQYISDILVK